MKLATLKDSTRDGRLVVVSKDLTRCSEVGHIARTLQAALDDWAHTAPRLARVAEGLETGAQPTMRFHEHDAASPLPRAFQWAVGVQNGSGGAVIEQNGSDGFLCPRDAIQLADGAWGLECQGGIAVIIDDVPVGATREQARDAIRLVMLVNDLSLTNIKSGDYQSRPAASFSPVAVTPDELGDALSGGKLDLPLKLELNGKPLDGASTGTGALFDFAELIVAAARTRRLSAGTIIGARPDAQSASALKSGDTIRIAMKDKAGHSIFGAIEQVVK